MTICRELTKQFETVQTMRCAEAPVWLAADANRQRGEFVVVLHARAAGEAPKADFEPALAVLLRELPLKQAVALCAEICAAPRNAVYAGRWHRNKTSLNHALSQPAPQLAAVGQSSSIHVTRSTRPNVARKACN